MPAKELVIIDGRELTLSNLPKVLFPATCGTVSIRLKAVYVPQRTAPSPISKKTDSVSPRTATSAVQAKERLERPLGVVNASLC